MELEYKFMAYLISINWMLPGDPIPIYRHNQTISFFESLSLEKEICGLEINFRDMNHFAAPTHFHSRRKRGTKKQYIFFSNISPCHLSRALTGLN